MTIPMAGAAMPQQTPGQPMPGPMPGQPAPGQQPSPFGGFQAPAFGQPALAPKSSGGGMNKTLLIGLIAGGAVALVAVIGLVAWTTLSGSGSAVAGSDLTYLPDHCDLYGKVRVSELMKSGAFKQLTANVPMAAMQSDQFDPETVDSVVFGMILPEGAGQQPKGTAVIRAVAGKKLELIPQNQPGVQQKEETIAGHKVIVLTSQGQSEPQGFCQIDDTTVVAGTLSMLRTVLERGGPTTIPSALQAAMDQADFNQHVAVAVVAEGLEDLIPDGEGGPGGGGAMPLPGIDPKELLKKVEGAVLHASATSDIHLTGKAVCTDAAGAAEIKKVLDGLIGLGKLFGPAELKEMLDMLKIESSGASVSASVTIPAATLAKLQAGGGTPGPAPGGGFPGTKPGFPGTKPKTPGKPPTPSKTPFGF